MMDSGARCPVQSSHCATPWGTNISTPETVAIPLRAANFSNSVFSGRLIRSITTRQFNSRDGISPLSSRGFFATRANPDVRSRLSKSKRSSSGNTARTKDQNAAAAKRKLFLEGSQNADVVGIAAGERSVAAHDHRVYGANLRRERVTFF